MNEKHRRLTTLLAFLQRHRGATVTRQQITDTVGGYAGLDDAIRKKLQRDLQVLESSCDLCVDYDASVDGYRVRRRPLTLKLEPSELASLAIVARMLGPEDRAGLYLEAMGAPEALELGVRAPVEPDPMVGALIEAIIDRRTVTFSYRKSGAARATTRTVHPWKVIYRGGWYLAGFDTGRKDRRTFKLSRISGELTIGDAVRPPYEIPDVIDDIREPWALSDDATAILSADPAEAMLIARRVRGRIRDHGDEATTIEAPYGDDAAFAGFLAGFGASVTVLEPSSLREAVIGHLRDLRSSIEEAR